MSQFTSAWQELYAAQTGATGGAITATVTGYASSKPAIVSALDLNLIDVGGGLAESGGFSIQMLASDLSAEPPKGTAISAGGSAAGHALQVFSVNINNGIAYIAAVDFATKS